MKEAKKIDISKLKTGFLGKCPSHPLSKILSSEPDRLTEPELLAKALKESNYVPYYYIKVRENPHLNKYLQISDADIQQRPLHR